MNSVKYYFSPELLPGQTSTICVDELSSSIMGKFCSRSLPSQGTIYFRVEAKVVLFDEIFEFRLNPEFPLLILVFVSTLTV